MKRFEDDLKALKSEANRLDTMKEDEFYCSERDTWVSKADTKHYDELEKRFESMVQTSATSRGIEYNDVIDLIYS